MLLRIIAHGLVLTLINLGSVVAGFVAYRMSGSRSQIPIQVTVASVLSIILFAAWIMLACLSPSVRFEPRGRKEWLGTYLSALVWSPPAFVALHYATQGYQSAAANVIALWKLQVPLNLIVILSSAVFCGRPSRKAGTDSPSRPQANEFSETSSLCHDHAEAPL